MTSGPFFSLIIPVYNVKAYLRECLDSVIGQRFYDWEAICVDDGSTDGSGNILDEYAGRDERIKVIHQSNSGVSSARNIALRMSRGQWIGFVDPDDILDSRWLEVARKGIVADVDMVRLDATIWKDGAPRPEVLEPSSQIIIRGGEEILTWGWRIMTKSGWAWASFVNKGILLGMPPEYFPRYVKYSEDSLFGLSLLYKVKCVAHICFNGYYYRIRPSSACGCERSVSERIAFYDAYQRVLQVATPCNVPSDLTRELNKLSFRFAWANLVVWAIRSSSIEDMKPLQIKVKCLALNQRWRVVDLSCHWWIAAWLFLRFGSVQPIRISSRIVRAGTRFLRLFSA